GLVLDAEPSGWDRLETRLRDLAAARLARAVLPVLHAPKRAFDVGQLGLDVVADGHVLLELEGLRPHVGGVLIRGAVGERLAVDGHPGGLLMEHVDEPLEAIAFGLEKLAGGFLVHEIGPFRVAGASAAPVDDRGAWETRVADQVNARARPYASQTRSVQVL